ncbi:hypothetical protein ABB37_04751 [Leptomonas pyrrhocoris]|uniref:Thioredoxin domain-containing protein n=1 Tax=Leptomonas pyrrhocoris TaxID=157538 RepID=A0A0N1J4U8_LEPPY|nr:hypothetical protein ABB37_04751 [Leptomonas pyrrhocoris]KPA80544.1 hypothetical protein ABB37_04751 [Leptomonas pyrrhocoris]|eukprot:XP_015658983.1 hypothetical protein ABB37_04751 [Leptomonas pyrrhocoris]
MYARISNALLARVNRVSSTYTRVASLSPSPATAPTAARAAEAPYTLGCGTVGISTWPPPSVPVIVTDTVGELQRRTPFLLPPLVVAYAALDAASAHPRHILRTPMTRSPMWCAATTRSQRGYALGVTTLHYANKSVVSPNEDESNSGDVGASPDAAAPSEVEISDNKRRASTERGSAVSSSTEAESSAAGTVVLPDAMVFSFQGSPHEFQDRLRGANVLVFFYKPVCGPCVAIRSKLIHAVADRLPMDPALFRHGGNAAPSAAAPSATAAPPGKGDGAQTAGSTSGAVDAASTQLHGEREPRAFVTPAGAETSMATEDKAACALACRTLEDVSKTYPNRMIFLTVDTNENAKLTALHDIRSLPTFFAYKNGRMMGRVEGIDELELSKLVHTIMREGNEAQTTKPAAEIAEAATKGTQ